MKFIILLKILHFRKSSEKHRQLLKKWIAETGDQGQVTESDAGLLATLKRWGDQCASTRNMIVYDRS